MIKKKVLSLIGSPREESISAHLQRLFLSGFADFAEIEEIRVYQHEINPCTACGHCKHLTECVFNDGMTSLYHSLENSNFITVSSPVYFSSLPG
ncbi:MAG TPA: flavodoxin family protein, partial [Spirochaetes bacterium]|nr:flavodoxin family protein [Spirochaetota bacterium]